jgi:hypothetical protein
MKPIFLKFITIFFFGFCYAQIATAQTWFPVNAEWTYEVLVPVPDYYDIISFKCIKDTTINGNMASVISETGLSYQRIFYYNPTEDIVYLFINDEFKPYFDFSKNAGESYYMYIPNVDYDHDLPYDSLEIHIDSIKNEIIDGIDVRVQYIKARAFCNYFFRGSIMEYIGGTVTFYPEPTLDDFMLFNGLHCYTDEYLSYYSNPIYQEKGCDYILRPNNIDEQSHKFSIYPNPANEYIMLEADEELAKIEIYNLMGKCVSSQECFTRNHSINLQGLNSGCYFIKAELITGNILTHKFIKKK